MISLKQHDSKAKPNLWKLQEYKTRITCFEIAGERLAGLRDHGPYQVGDHTKKKDELTNKSKID